MLREGFTVLRASYGLNSHKNHVVLNFIVQHVLYCPVVFGHFSPAPVEPDRAVRIQ